MHTKNFDIQIVKLLSKDGNNLWQILVFLEQSKMCGQSKGVHDIIALVKECMSGECWNVKFEGVFT